MALVHYQPPNTHYAAHPSPCAAFLVSISSPETEPEPLPKGYPSNLSTSLAWDGSKLTESQYIHHFSESDIKEIETGLETFKSYEIDGHLVNSHNFPLGQLQSKLQGVCHEIHNGKGFFLLRGLNPAKYTVEDSMTIFLGIQSYIAEQRARQDDKGNMVVHIISDSPSITVPPSKPMRALHARYSTSSIAFHTEETGDVLAWQTRGTAASGGRCIISSAYTIYNTLAATRPDIITTLARPDWPFELPYFHYRPILFYHGSHLVMNFGRASLLGNTAHPRSAGLPTLTRRQREALDAIEAIATANQFEFATQPGDIHFVNNLAVLHRREEFIDAEAGGKKRHLVRMRLRNGSKGWSVPAELKGFWDEAFDSEGDMVWHIEPMPEGFFPLRRYPF